VIDVKNRCVYSPHHAYLEVEPATSVHESILRVENASSFTLPPPTASSSTSVQTDLTYVTTDIRGTSSPGVCASSSYPLTDAPKRLASPLSPAPFPSPPHATSVLCDAVKSRLDPHASRYQPTRMSSHSADAILFVPPPPPHYQPCFPDTTSCSLRTACAPPDVLLDSPPAYPHPPCQFPTPPPPPQPPPPEPPSVLDSDDTLVKTLPSADDELPEHVHILFLQTVVLRALLKDHATTFAKDSADLGFCDVLQHDIDTGDAHPIKQSPCRPPLAAASAEDEILNEMLSTGVIEPSNSPWASPVCLVKKKEWKYRYCVDYRSVNTVSKKDASSVPDIHNALDHLRGGKYFAMFDLFSGYWQLGLTERAKESLAQIFVF